MNVSESLVTVAKWNATSSWQAGLLVLPVLFLQYALRNRLAPRWRYALWLPVFVRLLCPVFPESAVSVFNWVPEVSVRAEVAAPPAVIETAPAAAPIPTTVMPRPAPVVQPVPVAPPVASATEVVGAVEPVRWDVILSWVWLSGFLLWLGFVLIAYGRQRRVVHRMPKVTDAEILDLWNEARRRIGVGTNVELREAASDASPALFGFLRVRLLLPKELKQRLGREDLRHVFLHECAHLKRRDLPVNWLLALLQAAHWFNPLLWWASSRARADRELACDALALSAVEGRKDAYGETVIRLFEQVSGSLTQPGSIGVVERRSELRQRIRMIARYGLPLRWPALTGILLAALFVVTLTNARTENLTQENNEKKTPVDVSVAKKVKPRDVREIRFRTIDLKEDTPEAGVEVSVWFGRQKGKPDTVLTTDAKGECLIQFPDPQPNFTKVTTKKTGYVPYYDFWRRRDYTTEKQFGLRRPVTIGGIVQTEEGEPIEGAEVFLENSLLFGGPHLDLRGHTFRTDAEGRWSCDFFDDQPNRYYAAASHTNYAMGRGDDWLFRRRLMREDLRAERTVLVMKRGGRLQGTVTDRGGEPIFGARVRFHDIKETVLVTDDAGRYSLPRAIHGDVDILVTADGFAPEIKKVSAEPDMAAEKFALGPASVLRGQVVDEAGKPLEGAWVFPHEWRGHEHVFQFVLETGPDGRFVWSNAPPDKVGYGINKRGYVERFGHEMTAGPEEQTITLQREARQKGTVVDAQTGRPVENFTVNIGQSMRSDGTRIHWGMAKGEPASAGKFEVELTGHWDEKNVHLRIEAPGYAPFISQAIDRSVPELPPLNVRLQAAGDLRFRVRPVAGEPWPETDVYVLNGAEGPMVGDGEVVFSAEDNQKVRSTLDGWVTLPAHMIDLKRGDSLELLVVHPDGYTRTSLAEVRATGTLQLHEWGRIEGVRIYDGKPEPNRTLGVSYADADSSTNAVPFLDHTATTDHNGRFVFERVPPGRLKLQLHIKTGEQRWTLSDLAVVEVKPGQTSRTNPVQHGFAVLGQIVLPPGKDPQIDLTHATAVVMGGFQVPNVPDEVNSVEEHKKWLARWRQENEPGWNETVHANYPVKLKPDGSFVIHNLPAGGYTVCISVGQDWKRQPAPANQAKGVVWQHFIMPEFSKDFEPNPMDLGKLELRDKAPPSPNFLKAGMPAPVLDLVMLDGNPFRLSPEMQKRTLIYAFADHTQPRDWLSERLAAFANAAGDSDKWQLIALGVGYDEASLKKLADQHGSTWRFGVADQTTCERIGVGGAMQLFANLGAVYEVRKGKVSSRATGIGPGGEKFFELMGEQIRKSVAK